MTDPTPIPDDLREWLDCPTSPHDMVGLPAGLKDAIRWAADRITELEAREMGCVRCVELGHARRCDEYELSIGEILYGD